MLNASLDTSSRSALLQLQGLPVASLVARVSIPGAMSWQLAGRGQGAGAGAGGSGSRKGRSSWSGGLVPCGAGNREDQGPSVIG
jgi:hypothetical protein